MGTEDFELLVVFILGLCVGSFLNVVIYRLPRYISVVSPSRSFCPKCERQLAWHENIPVLSWVFLKARCKGCGTRISGQYPLVEIISGIAAVATYLHYGPTPVAGVVVFVLFVLIAISFIDLEHQIIPDRLSCTGAILGLALGVTTQFTSLFKCSPYAFCPITQGALDSVYGVLAGAGFFFVIERAYFYATKREGLGYGDIKLMAFTGAVLGLNSVAPTVFAGSLVGALIGIVAMVFSGKGRHTEIPFGPWLATGAVLYIFVELPFFVL